jgi:hypothetical protein
MSCGENWFRTIEGSNFCSTDSVLPGDCLVLPRAAVLNEIRRAQASGFSGRT